MMESRAYTRARKIARAKAKRRQAAIRKLTFAGMTALFVMIFGLSVFSMTAKANTNEYANMNKYYESHLIQQGETLWSIAEDNMDDVHYDSVSDYIDEVKEVNGFTEDELQSGNYILIPYFTEEARTQS